MSDKTVLFIGGSLDRKLLTMHSSHTTYRVAHCDFSALRCRVDETGEPNMYYELYNQYMDFDNIFIAENMSRTEAINRMQELMFKGIEND